jgi:hypothetical protein
MRLENGDEIVTEVFEVLDGVLVFRLLGPTQFL